MRVLVTGAAGFIGFHTAIDFQRRGFDVVGWDRIKKGGCFPILEVDMNNSDEVTEKLNSLRPDIIIHCAGSANVGESMINPTKDFQGNVIITHNILFALHKLRMEKTRFVFLSSAGVYGNPSSLPIKEDDPLKPLSPYALHKVMCEELCQYFVNNYHMNVKIARIFSAYGVGLRKQIFWDMYNKLIRHGRLDMLGTGWESRDYIHVDDVTQALYLLATTDSTFLTFNVANGEEVTIREATEIFADIVGVDRNSISFDGEVREGNPLNWKADITRIRELGYHKTIDIKRGLFSYVKWAEGQE